jgi:hypothetical protein
MARKKDTQPADRLRRQFLQGAGLAGLAGAGMAAFSGAANADTPPSAAAPVGSTAPTANVAAAKRGVYLSVPLRQDTISVAALQSRVRSVDVHNLAATMQSNLDHVLRLIDLAQGSPEEWGGEQRWGGHQDLICLHEFPLQGFQPWTRKELQRVAIDLPGPETQAIGARAKRYHCYIAFGCYAKLKDWPGHVINMSVIVGPTGEIVSTQWKSRNILGLFGARYLSDWKYGKRTDSGVSQSPGQKSGIPKFDVPFLSGGDVFGWKSPDMLGWLEKKGYVEHLEGQRMWRLLATAPDRRQ